MKAQWNEANAPNRFRKAACALRDKLHFDPPSRGRTRRPFVQNDEIKQGFLDNVSEDVLGAIAGLELASQHAEHWADYETIISFKNELESFLSNDDGECGFIAAYIE